MTRFPPIPVLLIAATALTACAGQRPPEIAFDDQVPALAPPPPPPPAEGPPRPVHIPPAWTPSRGGDSDAATAEARIIAANAAARVEPRQEGYYNAMQVFPWSEGALYQVYAAPGQITNIALEAGERLTGPGPIAAGDTARWIIGDTTSGAGRTARVHILVKPTRPDITTNLVVNTDRRTYHIELRANEEAWMPSIAWAYPAERMTPRAPILRRPTIPTEADRHYRYGLQGDSPAWRPTSVFDDGRRVYVVFPPGIAQGEMPPLFVIGADGRGQIVNTRVSGNVLIVDQLFGAARSKRASNGADTMTQPTNTEEPQNREEDIAKELRLRPDPPGVMRLSRRAIALATAIGGLGLGAVLIIALQNNRQADTQTELFSTERIQAAEGLSTLPRDYADIPRLGPPLPGELGRAILGAQDRGQPVPAPPLTGLAPPTVDPEEQRRLQELDAARLSTLFAEAQTVPRGGTAATPTLPATGALFPSSLNTQTASDPVSSREAFLTGAGNTDTLSTERIMPPPSPYILQAGTVIPAALITGLRSDLPGQISAQVTTNVYDSPSGRYLMIPQGARLLGEYDSRIASGQSRLLLVWTRLILPDGRSIVLGREPGTDSTGAAGLQDRVNYHWGRVFLAAGLATILNLGLETGAESEDDVATAIREAAQDTIGRTGDEIVRQQIAVPPTLTIRPGFPVRVMVTRDLILEPLGVVR